MGVLFVPENNFINKSIRKASSLARYSIRAKKDACLFDDVETFWLHRQKSTSHFVDKLLNNEFVLARHSDPDYPA